MIISIRFFDTIFLSKDLSDLLAAGSVFILLRLFSALKLIALT